MYAIDYEDFGTPAPAAPADGQAAAEVSVEIDGRAVTVPEGTSRLRVTVHWQISRSDLERFASSVEDTLRGSGGSP